MANTDTFDEMRGSTWSPATSSFRPGQYGQACSGEWPPVVMTRQAYAPNCSGRHPAGAGKLGRMDVLEAAGSVR